MQKYKALKAFSLGPDEAKVNYEVDAIFEMEEDGEVTKELLADGSIELAPATEDVDHEITQADLDANPELVTEGVKVGDVIKIPLLVDEADKQKAKEEYEASEKTVAASKEEAPAKVARKFYRNSLIVEEAPRRVGMQTFQHIKTVEGHAFDLTEDEYNKDVTVE